MSRYDEAEVVIDNPVMLEILLKFKNRGLFMNNPPIFGIGEYVSTSSAFRESYKRSNLVSPAFFYLEVAADDVTSLWLVEDCPMSLKNVLKDIVSIMEKGKEYLDVILLPQLIDELFQKNDEISTSYESVYWRKEFEGDDFDEEHVFIFDQVNGESFTIENLREEAECEEDNTVESDEYVEENILENGEKLKIVDEKEGIEVNEVSSMENFIIIKTDNEAILKKYSGNQKNISVSSEITIIGDHAFEKCRSLVTVVIPSSVKEIGTSAFDQCKKLTSVEIAKSVKKIGDCAFYECINLVSIHLPEDIEDIGSSIFYGCKGLTSITIPYGVKEIKRYSLCGCENLTSITIPESVVDLGQSALRDCKKLTSVVIPERMKKIDDHVFNGCESLLSIDLPDSIEKIGMFAFYNCKALLSISIPNNVKEIGIIAFDGCPNLTIRASHGSFAITYAKKNGIKYVEL